MAPSKSDTQEKLDEALILLSKICSRLPQTPDLSLCGGRLWLGSLYCLLVYVFLSVLVVGETDLVLENVQAVPRHH